MDLRRSQIYICPKRNFFERRVFFDWVGCDVIEVDIDLFHDIVVDVATHACPEGFNSDLVMRSLNGVEGASSGGDP